jgi:hypothetical protein
MTVGEYFKLMVIFGYLSTFGKPTDLAEKEGVVQMMMTRPQLNRLNPDVMQVRLRFANKSLPGALTAHTRKHYKGIIAAFEEENGQIQGWLWE